MVILNQPQLDLLVVSAQIGNVEAFNALVQHYHPMLQGFAFRLCGDRQIAQDAVQDTWLKLSKNLVKLEDPAAFKSWAFKTLRWRLTDIHRQQGGIQWVDLDEHHLENTSTPSTDVQRDMLTLIQQLPELEKQVVYLFYLDEMSLKEISEVLGLAVGTVKSRLNRARNHIRQWYLN